MKKRLAPFIVIIAVAAALFVPAVAVSAHGAKWFPRTAPARIADDATQPASFYGRLYAVQTDSGNPQPHMYGSLFAMRNEGQEFQGRVTDTDLGLIKDANVTVHHNSTITFGSDFDDDGRALLVGFAWGSFDLAQDRFGEAGFSGNYTATIQGIITMDKSCPADRLLTQITGRPFQARVEVIDTGTWTLTNSAGDPFDQIGDTGTVLVRASGCLDQETAYVTIGGVKHDVGWTFEERNDGSAYGVAKGGGLR